MNKLHPIFQDALRGFMPQRETECYVCGSPMRTHELGDRVFCCTACEDEYAGIDARDRMPRDYEDDEND